SELLLPALHAPLFGLGVDPRQVGADAEHALDAHGPRDHEARIAPHVLAPRVRRRAEEVADDLVERLDLLLPGALRLDLGPVLGDPAVKLVEELGLQDSFLLVRSATETVDLVTERAVRLRIEQLGDASRELFVGGRPRDLLV